MEILRIWSALLWSIRPVAEHDELADALGAAAAWDRFERPVDQLTWFLIQRSQIAL